MLKPLHNRILIQRQNPEEKTASGIIIPDTAKEKPQKGTVIAVGPGNKDKTGKVIPMDVKKGDTVLFQIRRHGNLLGWQGVPDPQGG